MATETTRTEKKWIAPRNGGYSAATFSGKRPRPPETPATIKGVRAADRAKDNR